LRSYFPKRSVFDIEGDPVQLEIASDFVEGLNLLPSVHLWTILMHRYDGSLNFNRNWTEYKNGFGDIGRGEFWIGNEKMHRMTNRNVYTLRIEVFQYFDENIISL